MTSLEEVGADDGFVLVEDDDDMSDEELSPALIPRMGTLDSTATFDSAVTYDSERTGAYADSDSEEDFDQGSEAGFTPVGTMMESTKQLFGSTTQLFGSTKQLLDAHERQSSRSLMSLEGGGGEHMSLGIQMIAADEDSESDSHSQGSVESMPTGDTPLPKMEEGLDAAAAKAAAAAQDSVRHRQRRRSGSRRATHSRSASEMLGALLEDKVINTAINDIPDDADIMEMAHGMSSAAHYQVARDHVEDPHGGHGGDHEHDHEDVVQPDFAVARPPVAVRKTRKLSGGGGIDAPPHVRRMSDRTKGSLTSELLDAKNIKDEMRASRRSSTVDRIIVHKQKIETPRTRALNEGEEKEGEVVVKSAFFQEPDGDENFADDSDSDQDSDATVEEKDAEERDEDDDDNDVRGHVHDVEDAEEDAEEDVEELAGVRRSLDARSPVPQSPDLLAKFKKHLKMHSSSDVDEVEAIELTATDDTSVISKLFRAQQNLEKAQRKNLQLQNELELKDAEYRELEDEFCVNADELTDLRGVLQETTDEKLDILSKLKSKEDLLSTQKKQMSALRAEVSKKQKEIEVLKLEKERLVEDCRIAETDAKEAEASGRKSRASLAELTSIGQVVADRETESMRKTEAAAENVAKLQRALERATANEETMRAEKREMQRLKVAAETEAKDLRKTNEELLAETESFMTIVEEYEEVFQSYQMEAEMLAAKGGAAVGGGVDAARLSEAQRKSRILKKQRGTLGGGGLKKLRASFVTHHRKQSSTARQSMDKALGKVLSVAAAEKQKLESEMLEMKRREELETESVLSSALSSVSSAPGLLAQEFMGPKPPAWFVKLWDKRTERLSAELAKARMHDSSRSMQQDFFKLCATALKIQMSKRKGISPEMLSSSQSLWERANYLAVPFEDYYDHIASILQLEAEARVHSRFSPPSEGSKTDSHSGAGAKVRRVSRSKRIAEADAMAKKRAQAKAKRHASKPKAKRRSPKSPASGFGVSIDVSASADPLKR